MPDSFSGRAGALNGPADSGFAITPNDVAEFSHPTRAIYVGNGGDVAVELLSGEELTFANAPQGSMLPIRVVKVLTETTASALLGLY